jgi:hypothetical protein
MDVAAGALVDQHVLDGVAAAQGQRLVDDALQRQLLAAARLLVGGDHGHGAGVLDAVAQALAEKPPNTTECVAPMRAQACMAATPSTTSACR